MPLAIASVHFDTIVNFGIFGGSKILQKVLGINVDGKVGSDTLRKMHVGNSKEIALDYCDARIEMRYILVKKYAKYKKFLRGWLNRDKKLKKIIGNYF